MVVFIVLAVLALGGGGVSFAAEGAVPGDALYGVKTMVNEEVRGMIAIGADADAKWQSELAVRRLDEAAELDARGELDAEESAELNEEFDEHVEAALRNIGSSGQDGVSIDLGKSIRARIDAAVAAHSEIFAPRDAASGQASGKRVFVIPHVLEASGSVKSPRDAASGQATGKIHAADIDADDDAVVTSTTTKETDSTSRSGTSGEVKAGGTLDSTEVKAGYNVKTETRI